MVPEHLAFGGGAQETTIHPGVAVYVLLAVVLVLFLPRRSAIAPFLFAYFTVTLGQVVVLGSVHFTVLRFLILAGLVRMAFTQGTSSGGRLAGGLNGIDKVVILWSVSAVIAIVLYFRESGATVKAMGTLLDTLGGYVAVRFLIPDGPAMRRAIKTLAAICAVNGASMIYEKVSGINLFGYMGGLPVEAFVRDGHIRASGVFGYLWAGAFAGASVPLFVWLWSERKSRPAALIGFAGATAMVIASYSSTSFLAYGGAILAFAFWPLRQKMRFIRWGLAVILITLHIVMKAPVWALIARVNLTGSSAGTQRYMLVDMTIRHFSAWWLIGTDAYQKWGWDSWDLCNQFVAVALTGGLFTLIFYIAIFKRCFGSIGATRKLVEGNRSQEWFLWCFASALFATVVAHFGINYMAQLIMGFFTLVACIVVATSEARQAAIQTVATPAPARGHLALAPRAAVGTLALRKVKPEMGHRASKPKRERPLWLKA
jgi:hypothetical protein